MSKLGFLETNVFLLCSCVILAVSLEMGTFSSQINVTFRKKFPLSNVSCYLPFGILKEGIGIRSSKLWLNKANQELIHSWKKRKALLLFLKKLFVLCSVSYTEVSLADNMIKRCHLLNSWVCLRKHSHIRLHSMASPLLRTVLHSWCT